MRNRFWSNFSATYFDDAQLEAGIAEIEERFPATLEFRERMVLITATKA